MDTTQRKVLINTAPGAGEATWAEIGEGATSVVPSSNSNIQTKYYINSLRARVKKTSENKQWALSMDVIEGDAANDYLASLAEKCGKDAESQLLIYDDKDGGEGDNYPAKVYPVIVDVTNDGNLEGGNDVTMEITIYQNGDIVKGNYKPSTKKFTEG